MPFPTDEQKKVIDHRGRPLVVVAGPGTGKTATLVERMIQLLRDKPGAEVVFITFTRTSRKDTHRKIQAALGQEGLRNPSGTPRSSTLHTYAKSIVYRSAERVGRDRHFSVLNEMMGEGRLVLDELVFDLGLDVPDKVLDDAITEFRCTGSWPADFIVDEGKRAEILQQLEKLLSFYNTFDFDGIVEAAVYILEREGELPEIYLHVDEYQDLNPIDQKLVKLAAMHKKSEVVIVGDDAQSIYTFRHANYEGLRELWETGEWDNIPLTHCFRLPPHILRAAQTLIAGRGYVGDCLAPAAESDKRILTLHCTTDGLQVEAIAKAILSHQSKVATGETPLAFSDFMVLCPTKTQVEAVATALEQDFGIPTRRQPKPEFPEDHWRLLLVLRMILGGDSLALRQWLEIAGIARDRVQELRRTAMQKTATLYGYCQALDDPSLGSMFSAIDRLRGSLDDVPAFLQGLVDFPHLNITPERLAAAGLDREALIDKHISVGSIVGAMHEMAGFMEGDGEAPESNSVLVGTLHAAKGLEAKYVFITHLTATFFPQANVDPEEARRIFYVALTRAKRDVILLLHDEFDKARKRRIPRPSQFLIDIRPHLDQRRVKVADVRKGRPGLVSKKEKPRPRAKGKPAAGRKSSAS